MSVSVLMIVFLFVITISFITGLCIRIYEYKNKKIMPKEDINVSNVVINTPVVNYDVPTIIQVLPVDYKVSK